MIPASPFLETRAFWFGGFGRRGKIKIQNKIGCMIKGQGRAQELSCLPILATDFPRGQGKSFHFSQCKLPIYKMAMVIVPSSAMVS